MFSQLYISIPYLWPILVVLHLLTHVSLLHYSILSNMFTFRRTLAYISTRYPCISSSWTQWVKNNNKPNYSQMFKALLSLLQEPSVSQSSCQSVSVNSSIKKSLFLYYASSSTTTKLIWIQSLFHELGISLEKPSYGGVITLVLLRYFKSYFSCQN